jgi:hypothetical protein
MTERRDDGFLARWSRRKHAARAAEREPEAPHRAAEEPTRPADAPAAERPEAAAPAPALPDPATLDASSDFSVFLGRDVPIETHRAALRRLWRVDPFYNAHDGLSDYMEDFTDQARAVKNLRTAYRVGRGLLERVGEPADAAASGDPDPAAKATPAALPDPPARDRDRPASGAAGSLGPAAPLPPAREEPASSAGAQPDETGAARAGCQPAGASARTARGNRRRPLPKRS